MPRKLIGGLIQAAAIDAHIPLIEEAGRQDAHWYDTAEAVPGPTADLDMIEDMRPCASMAEERP